MPLYISKKHGITAWEIALFMIFLAIAVGSSVFFFFLNSDDVQQANKKYDWVENTNIILDEVCLEIANSIIFEHPFTGVSHDCFFRVSEDTTFQSLSNDQEGFIFKENKLIYLSKNENGINDRRRLRSFPNPLLENCSDGTFNRLSPDRLEIKLSISESADTKPYEFLRIIKLRNQ